MAYIRTKTINGKAYRYLVEGRRIKGKVKQRVVKYMGAVDPIYRQKRRKSNAWLFARNPMPEEEEALRKTKRSSDAFTRDRARTILFSAEHKSCSEIAEKLSCDARKVRNAVKDFNRRGLACLVRSKAKGAEPKFTNDIKKQILGEFARDPLDRGYTFTAWTLPRFRKHLLDGEVVDSISVETVRQIILKAGARLTKSKRWQYSPDPQFGKKNR